MSRDDASTEKKLVDLLGSAASYNDKGIEWRGHSREKAGEMQAQFCSAQLLNAREIGPERLGLELFRGIERGAVAKDGSGEYAEFGERGLGLRRSGA